MNLNEISKIAKDCSPAFIIGEARSGSTLLNRTLELHSSFRPKKIELHESKLFSYTNRSYQFSCEKWTGPIDYMLGDQYFFGLFFQAIKEVRKCLPHMK